MRPREDARWTRPELRQVDVKSLIDVATDIVAQGAGRIVFMAGDEGSGRTHFVNRLAERLVSDHSDIRVVAGDFSTGEYSPWPTPRRNRLPRKSASLIGEGLSLVAPIAGAATASPAIASILAFTGQLLQTATAAQAVHEANTRAQARSIEDISQELSSAFRRAADAGPLVVLIDNIDRSIGSWIFDVLLALAAYVSERPVLLVCSLVGPQHLVPCQKR